MAHFVEQREELTNNKWVLSVIRNRFKIPFKSVPPLSVVLINLSQSSSPLLREEIVELLKKMSSGKGSESGNSRFLFPAIPSTQKERKVTSRDRPILIRPLYTQTTLQNGDSQVGKTIENLQRLGCLHRSNGCISSCSDTSDFQQVPTFRLRPPGISIHGLTVRNVPKSVGFHEANERHSNTFTSTCSISISIPRRLADKRSDAQSTYLSHQICSSNGLESRFHSKSKVRFNSNTTIHIYRYGISNSTENSQSSSGSNKSSYSYHQNNSLTNSGVGTDFPFSFGQTKCSSRLNSSGQIAFMTPANVPIIGLETSQTSSRSSDNDHQDDLISFKMVDELQSICSGNAHSPSRPPNLPLHGCQSFRLGSSSRTDESILLWSLVGRPILTPYQHVGNNGHSFRTDKNLKYIRHSCVMVSTDNTIVVSYINKQGGMLSPDLCVQVWKILLWCLKHQIVVRIRHIPDRFNVLAGKLSRIDKVVKTE